MIYTSTARASELSTAGELNNPFVAWDNLGASATLGGASTITGGEAANAVTGSTYDKWRPVATGTTRRLSFDFGSARTISFAAICAHNLATLGRSVAVQRSSDDVTYTDAGCGVVTPTDNGVVAFRMVTSGQDYRYWRFSFSSMDPADELAVGVAFMGDDLVIPRRFYQGFSPIITPTEVQLQSNVSVGNELLGSSVIGRGSTLSANVTNVDPDFVRGASWLAFQRHFNDGGGAFFGWRPQKYPEDVHYIWRSGAILRPVNSGPRDLMSVSIEAQAHNAQT